MNERVEPPREGGTWSTGALVHQCRNPSPKGAEGEPGESQATCSHTHRREKQPAQGSQRASHP